MLLKESNNELFTEKNNSETVQEEERFLKQARKYKSIKLSIENGVFTKFENILSIVPPTNVGKDIAINFHGFKKKSCLS